MVDQWFFKKYVPPFHNTDVFKQLWLDGMSDVNKAKQGETLNCASLWERDRNLYGNNTDQETNSQFLALNSCNAHTSWISCSFLVCDTDYVHQESFHFATVQLSFLYEHHLTMCRVKDSCCSEIETMIVKKLFLFLKNNKQAITKKNKQTNKKKRKKKTCSRWSLYCVLCHPDFVIHMASASQMFIDHCGVHVVCVAVWLKF